MQFDKDFIKEIKTQAKSLARQRTPEQRTKNEMIALRFFEEEFLDNVYDILTNLGGASEKERDIFIYTHLEDKCEEWRFGGKLGFGGKYWSKRNEVTCNQEDLAEELKNIIKLINKELKEIKNKFTNASN